LILLAAGGVRRIVEGPVVAVHLAGKHRAGLVGVAADGDHGFHLVVEEKIHVLRLVRADVDADLGQRLDGERVDVSGGLRAGAFDAEAVAERAFQDAFGEVRAAAVAGAEDEDGGGGHGFMKDEGEGWISGWRSPRRVVRQASAGRAGEALRSGNTSFEPQGHVHEADEHRHLDERTDDRREGDARADAEDRDGHGDGEFEVVARGGEGQGGRAAVVGPELSAHEKTNQEHDDEIDGQRNGDAHDIERQLDDLLALEREHHDDGEKQGC
jgi:hypothetical protein